MEASTGGTLVRALVAGRAVRLLLVDAKGIAEHTRVLHGLGPGATRLAAEAVVAASLGLATVKGEEQLTWQLQGEKPRCSVYVDATAQGNLRVKVSPPDVGYGAGAGISGMLLVIKHSPGGEVYRGASGLAGEGLESAIAKHLATSDQIDVILRIGCTLGPDGAVRWAGGLMLERLPSDPSLPSLSPEEFAERYSWVGGADLQELMLGAAFGSLGGEGIELLERSTLRWKCRCGQAKIEETLAALDAQTLTAMIEEDHGAEVTCNFCGAVYDVTEERLRELAAVRARLG